jgi:PAS domain-containing protein
LIHPDQSQFLSPLVPCPTEDEVTALRAALAENDRASHSLLRSLSGLFYRSELQSPWRMSFVSGGVEELTATRKDGWASIMRPEDKVAVESAVAEAISQNSSFEVTYRINAKNGEVRWVSERGHAVYDDEGRPLFLEGMIRDISGRKEADELQKTMLGRWRKTLDTIPQMVWTMAADGSDEFYNAQWEKFTGRRLRGESDLGRLELVHADDRARAKAIWKKQFAKGETYEAQYRLRHVSGEYPCRISTASPSTPSRSTGPSSAGWRPATTTPPSCGR